MARRRFLEARAAAMRVAFVAVVAVVAFVAVVAIAPLARAQTACDPADMGCAIFNGQHPMTAHLRDDERPLPSFATRCVNCHVGTSTKPAFAPPLTHDALLGVASRRGGPLSHYDATSFCRAVKDGIDPAGVLLRKSMPHYRIADTECQALWQYVMHR